jgi:hypothetical protein
MRESAIGTKRQNLCDGCPQLVETDIPKSGPYWPSLQPQSEAPGPAILEGNPRLSPSSYISRAGQNPGSRHLATRYLP